MREDSLTLNEEIGCSNSPGAKQKRFARCVQTQSCLESLLHLGEESVPIASAKWPVSWTLLVQVTSRIRHEVVQKCFSHCPHPPVPVQPPPLNVRRGGELLDDLPNQSSASVEQ